MTQRLERLSVDLVANSTAFVRELSASERATQQWARRTQSQFQSTARSLAGVFGAGVSTAGIIALGDAYTNVQNRIRQVTDSQREFNQANEAIFGIARDTRANLGAVATLYSRTAQNADQLGISTAQVGTVTKAITQALAAYGATAQEAQSVTIQLSQAFAANRLAGEEFRAVSEAAPPLLRAIAAEAGVTRGELKELGSDGKLSGELIARALLNASDTFEDEFLRSLVTVNQSLEVARTNVTQWVGESEELQSVLSATGKIIIAVSENMDTIATVAGVAATVYAARLVPAAVAATKSFVVMQAAAARQAVLLAGVSTTSTLAATSLGGLAIAGRAAGTALAFVGGPVGVAVLAAAALVAFGSAAETASERSARLSREARELNDALGDLSVAGLRSQIAPAIREIQTLENELAEAQAALEERQAAANNVGTGFLGSSVSEIRGVGEAATEVQRLADELAVAEARLKDVQQRLADLRNEGSSTGDSGADTTNEQLDRTIVSLERQVALYGNVSEAAKLRYEIERNGFDGSSVEQQNKALELAVQLDAKRAADKAAKDKELDEAEAKRIQDQNDRIVSLQQEKFRRISEAALAAQGDTAGVEELRFQAAQEQLQRELEQLRTAKLLTLEIEREFVLAKEDLYTEHRERLAQIEQDAAENQAQAEQDLLQARLQAAGAFFSALGQLAADGTKAQRALFFVEKAISLAAAIVAMNEAVARANAEPNLAVRAAAIATARVTGAAAIAGIASATIAGAAHGGLENVPSESTFLLQQGERVLSPSQNKDLTDYLQNRNGTGTGIEVNLIEDSSRAGTADQEGDRVNVYVDRIRAQLGQEIRSGRGLGRDIEASYNVGRRGRA